MRYHVRKKKSVRISYRVLGIFFMLLAVAQIWMLVHMVSAGRFLMGAMAVFLAYYGFYLFKMSFRNQAYDMIYEFQDAEMIIHFHKGRRRVPYAQVKDVQILAPDPDIPYRIIRIKVGKENYVLPVSRNPELADDIFQFVYSRVF